MNLVIDNPDLATGAENVPSFRPLTDGISAYELWQVQKLKRDLRQEYLDYWNASVELTGTGRPVDAILSPCAPYVAPPHGMNKSVFFIISEWCSGRRGFTFHFVGTRITRRYGMDWTILPSYCQLG
jgi:amidase